MILLWFNLIANSIFLTWALIFERVPFNKSSFCPTFTRTSSEFRSKKILTKDWRLFFTTFIMLCKPNVYVESWQGCFYNSVLDSWQVLSRMSDGYSSQFHFQNLYVNKKQDSVLGYCLSDKKETFPSYIMRESDRVY